MSADKALGHDDVPQIASELCEVQTKSNIFGRVLGLSITTVDTIHQQYSNPQEFLFGVLDEFVKQVEPPPTWRVILEALRNPLIGQGNLAQQIERKLFPDQYDGGIVAPSSPSIPTPSKVRKIDPQQSASYTCQVSGPGLTSATVNHPTHILVELMDSSGRPYSPPLNITAQLQLVLPSCELLWKANLSVVKASSSEYKVSYKAFRQGQYQLHVLANGTKINGSPFNLTAFPDPLKIKHPVRILTDLDRPYGVAISKDGKNMFVSEFDKHKISVIDIEGHRTHIGSHGDEPKQMIAPAGIATDDTDNIYVSSQHKLQKFTSSGKFIKCVGQWGRKKGEFDDPRGIALYNNRVYVCDRDNHRIQVFDCDLNWIRFIGSHGDGNGELDSPYDIKFDTAGNMYVAERDNRRVQMMDTNGQHIRSFCHEVEGKKSRPSGVHIADKFVYVSDWGRDCIVVYEITSGKFVTSFGRCGSKEGEFIDPRCITSCVNGHIYICDYHNNRVQIF